MNNLQ